MAEKTWIIARRLFPGGGHAPESDRAIGIAEGRIAEVRAASELPEGAVAAEYPVVAPGFIDLQINGGGGTLFNDAPTPEAVARIAAAARRGGTAHILPTFVTAEDATYTAALEAVSAVMAVGAPGAIGIHLEGPFLSPRRPGIHPARHIRPMTDVDAALISAFPHRLLLTVAPEEVEPRHLSALVGAGVIVFAGHTEATLDQMARAADAGLSGVTHLWNAMSQLQARAPGVVGAALTDRRLSAGIIADGIHVHPANLRLAAAAMGDRLFLVSDAMATLGSDIDRFELGGAHIRREGGRLVSPEGTLAGAHLAMDEAVRNMIGLAGVSLANALHMASGRPAKVLGLEGVLGRVAPGYRASLTCLDAGLHALAVMVDGRWPDAG